MPYPASCQMASSQQIKRKALVSTNVPPSRSTCATFSIFGTIATDELLVLISEKKLRPSAPSSPVAQYLRFWLLTFDELSEGVLSSSLY